VVLRFGSGALGVRGRTRSGQRWERALDEPGDASDGTNSRDAAVRNEQGWWEPRNPDLA